MRRPVSVLSVVIVATLALTGCTVLAPTRNADGTIVKALLMPSTDAWVGDCFSFVPDSNLSLATVVPCAETHSHVVIGKGTLSTAKIGLFESLQIAVISSCQSVFDSWSQERETDPQPEYIVSKEDKPGGEVTNYSCLATDGTVAAAP